MKLPDCLFFHKWGKWNHYHVNGTCVRAFSGKAIPYSEIRQRRQCERCGKIQDEVVAG